MHTILWLLAAAGAIGGAAILVSTLMSATGAPQEAAGAAIACAVAIAPYVLARAFGELLPRASQRHPSSMERATVWVALAGFVVFAVLFVEGTARKVPGLSAGLTAATGRVEAEEGQAGPDEAAKRKAKEDLERLLADLKRWRVDVTRSAVDDTMTIVISKLGDGTLHGRFSEGTPNLFLRCRSNQTEVYVSAGTVLERAYGDFDRSLVRYRFDTGPPKSARLGLSTDGEAVFLPSPIPLIRQMLQHATLVVELTPSDRGPQAVTFDLTGLGDQIGKLQDACGWK